MKDFTVGIFGGGLAGLTTAYLLIKRELSLPENVKVKIELFEATDRIGGRAYTLRGFENDLYAEAGALSISDNQAAILGLAQELGVSIVSRQDRAKKRYFEHGQWKNESDVTNIMQYIMGKIEQLKKEGIILNENDWISTEVSKKKILDSLDSVTIIEYLKNAIKNGGLLLQEPENLQRSVAASLLGHYSDDVATLSAWGALRYLSQYKDTKCVLSVKGGNDNLPLALYQAIHRDVSVQFNSPVVSVTSKDNGKLVVSALSDNMIKQREFDYVVLAVPLTALQSNTPQHIKFYPPLPTEKIKAFDGISYNRNVTRVYYEVQSRFWKSECDTAMTITDTATHWIEDHTAHIPNQYAVLESHGSGQFGKHLLESEEPEVEASDHIKAVYGEKFEQARTRKPPITFLWRNHIYQRGSYPFFGVNQKKYMKEILKNVGKIYFAGEYTSIGEPASMSGAVNSALRVFDELKNAISLDENARKRVVIKSKL